MKNVRKCHNDGCLPCGFPPLSQWTPPQGLKVPLFQFISLPSLKMILYHFLESLEPVVLLCLLAEDQGQGCNCLPTIAIKHNIHKYTHSVSQCV